MLYACMHGHWLHLRIVSHLISSTMWPKFSSDLSAAISSFVHVQHISFMASNKWFCVAFSFFFIALQEEYVAIRNRYQTLCAITLFARSACMQMVVVRGHTPSAIKCCACTKMVEYQMVFKIKTECVRATRARWPHFVVGGWHKLHRRRITSAVEEIDGPKRTEK